jgi:mono/diheme cytochrome c family protein
MGNGRLWAPLILAMAGTLAPADDRGIGESFGGVKLTKPGGGAVSLETLKGAKATVVVFLSFECPVAVSYTEPLSELATQFKDRGVNVVGVLIGDDDKAVAGYKLSFPVYRDSGPAADKLQAEYTPETFVFDADLKMRYRGRIDDAYAARLKRNWQVKSRDLADALDAVLAGKPVANPVTQPVGCPIEKPGAKPATAGAVTFHRDVEPILQRHCQTCHRPGEVGPFSLMTFQQSKKWADDIKEYTRSRQMPPWLPADGPAFRGERKLSDAEIATLAAWADGGAPQGDVQDAPPLVNFPDGWRNGPPDLVLTVPRDFQLGASGSDLFRVFVIPTGLTENRWVCGYDVKPGNPRVVHHTLNFFDASGKGREMEAKFQEKADPLAADRGPGYTVGMGVGFLPPARGAGDTPRFGGLGGWAPGQSPNFVPDGTGWLLPAGSDFLLQVHYHRDGRVATDRTQIGLYFARKPVEKPWQSIVVSGLGAFQRIPAGESHFVAKGAVYLHSDAVLHSVLPHMHLLGKSVKLTMTPPGGEPRVLVNIPNWDYNWQETYWFKEPIATPAGTKLEIEAVFDNSAGNPNNPSSPPKNVYRGEQTTDEMLFGFIGATSGSKLSKRVIWRPTPPKSGPG